MWQSRSRLLPDPRRADADPEEARSEEHTSELQSLTNLACRLLLGKNDSNLSQANPEHTHPFLVTDDRSNNIRFVVATTDKGPCVGINTNSLRLLTAKLRELDREGN